MIFNIFKKFFQSSKIFKNISLMFFVFGLLFGILSINIASNYTFGFFNNVATAFLAGGSPQTNYQGKLTETTGIAVPNNTYNIRFKFYTTSTGGSPIWTETHCYSSDSGSTCSGSGVNNKVQVTSGLFSTMLGSVNSLSEIDFNQVLYLGVEIGGTSSAPTGGDWDGEMSPRKRIGTVPSAFVANSLNGVVDTQLIRSDTANSASTSGSILTLTQTGSGKLIDLYASTTNVFSIGFNGSTTISSLTAGLVRSTSGGLLYTDATSYLTSYTETDPIWLAASSSYLTTASSTATYLTISNAATTYQQLLNFGTAGQFLVASSTSGTGYSWVNGTSSIFSTDGITRVTTEATGGDNAIRFYNSIVGYTSDVVPTMTSNTTPSGTSSASSVIADPTDYSAVKAFDDNTGTMWHSALTGAPFFLQYQFPTARTITKYELRPNNITSVWSWIDWQFQGSNNGSSWTTIDTQSGQTLIANQYNGYGVSNITAYTYYRFYITLTNGSNYATMQEVRLLENSSSVANEVMTIINSRVGVGTTSPVARFEVYGTAGNNAIANFASSSNVSAFYVAASGNVGIGTTTPGTMLVVTGTSTLQNILPGGPYTGNMSGYSLGASTTRWLSVWAETVNIGTSTWSLAQKGTRFGIFDQANASGTEALTILNSGNVGIGTTNPTNKLQVTGAGTTRVGINSTGNNAGFSLMESGVSRWSVASYSGGVFTLYNDVISQSVLSIVGNVATFNYRLGIATSTPDTALSVVGTTTSSGLKITSLSNSFLATDASGNVISTSSPISFVTSNYPTYDYASSTFVNYAYASSTFASTTFVTGNFPTFEYASSTFLSLNQSSAQTVSGGQPIFSSGIKTISIKNNGQTNKIDLMPQSYVSTFTNLIPIMTGYTTPSGTSSSGGELGGQYVSWKAFDHDTTTYNAVWAVTGSVGWLGYQFTSAQVIDTYKVTNEVNAPTLGPERAPKDWTFEGSNNGSSWTTLDTRSSQTGWASGETRTFSFVNTTSYTHYRINITANNGGAVVDITELQMANSGSNPTPEISFVTNDVERMRILENGGIAMYTSLGVGTTSTSSALTVIGTSTVDGLSITNLANTFLVTNSLGNVVSTTSPLSIVSSNYPTYDYASSTFVNYAYASSTFASTSYITATYVPYTGATSNLNLGSYSINSTDSTSTNVYATTIRNSGRTYLADGTAGSPPLTFTNATNMGFYNRGSNTMGVVANGQEAMMISGNTGVGTLAIGNIVPANEKFLITGAGSSDFMRISSDNSETGQIFMIKRSGNVGIGSTNPATKLHVHGTSASTDATIQIVGNGVSTLFLGQDADGGVLRGQGGNNALKFLVGGSADTAASAGGTEAMRILSSGYVGIGTTTPGTMLVVTGTSTLQNILPAGPYTGNMSGYSLGASTTRWASVWAETVNIGTSTWSLKQTGSRLGIFTGPDGSGSEALTILSNGNVGIGTTTPGSAFSIVGDVNFTGSINATSGIQTALIYGSSTNKINLAPATVTPTYSNLVPKMTGQNTPTGNITAGAGYDGNQGLPYMVFDHNTTNFWQPRVGNDYIQYQFEKPTIINTYELYTAPPNAGDPTAWTFAGSNDGSTFTTLDTRSGQAIGPSSVGRYQFNNSTAYSHYRMTVTNHNPNDGLMKISELTMSMESTNLDISFTMNSIEAMRIIQSGSVYIISGLTLGTTTKSLTKLDVYGTSGSSDDIFAISSSSGSRLFTVTSTGKVGIGTSTPSANLTASGTIRFTSLGSAGANLTTDSNGNVSASSDERLKNIQGDYERGLADIMNINPIRYKWKTETGYDTSNTYSGFSAQNMELAIPEAVATSSNGYLTLADRPVIAALVNAVKQIGSMFSKIQGGVAYLKSIVVETFAVGSNVKPSGITMYDEGTGEAYCVKITNGILINEFGPCTSYASTTINNLDYTASVLNSFSSTTSTSTDIATSSSESSTTTENIINVENNSSTTTATSTEDFVINEPDTLTEATSTQEVIPYIENQTSVTTPTEQVIVDGAPTTTPEILEEVSTSTATSTDEIASTTEHTIESVVSTSTATSTEVGDLVASVFGAKLSQFTLMIVLIIVQILTILSFGAYVFMRRNVK